MSNIFILLCYMLQLEKMVISREFEEKLEAESQRYEERMTELHCVIAELRRKLEQQRGHAIAEDDEDLAEDDEVSQDFNYQSGKDGKKKKTKQLSVLSNICAQTQKIFAETQLPRWTKTREALRAQVRT
jgi:hypothetical protein